jgi:hypothetical protein
MADQDKRPAKSQEKFLAGNKARHEQAELAKDAKEPESKKNDKK